MQPKYRIPNKKTLTRPYDELMRLFALAHEVVSAGKATLNIDDEYCELYIEDTNDTPLVNGLTLMFATRSESSDDWVLICDGKLITDIPHDAKKIPTPKTLNPKSTIH